MSVSVEYSIFADKSLVEADSGKVSLIGVFQAIGGDVALIPTLAFYCPAKGSPGKHQLVLKISQGTPDGDKEIGHLNFNLEINQAGMGFLTANLTGMPVLGDRIIFRLLDGTNVIHSNEIPVIRGSR